MYVLVQLHLIQYQDNERYEKKNCIRILFIFSKYALVSYMCMKM